jgi:predicted helicase
MTLEQYISNINKEYKRGIATEHTYRGDLKQLLESIVPDIAATNEPKRISCGAPDYVLTRKDIPFGFIEAKDIGDKDLSGTKKTGNKEQFDRYKNSLDNLIFTDYLDFHLYIDGVFITKVAIAEIVFDKNGASSVMALPENFTTFTNLIKDFCLHVGQTIKSSKKLAEMMAGKARLLSDIIEVALTNDENKSEDSTLKDQMNAFKEILIHDITPNGFADVYAQTIAYGMFCARLHDPTLPTFSRQEAAELIPKSNPFLRKLFGYIAGPDLDDRIKWVVDSLVDIFLACNVEQILKTYGKSTKMEDPIIHFYETFLSEYDPKLRKAKGVWYTPKPVVNFIVRAVDDILKTEFNLPQGLSDTSKTKIKVDLQGKKVEQEVHKVQILDPATGTGTFLAEVVKHIHKKFGGQQGIWSNYIETHLLPRLNGFELLMASYAMAHLQMDLLLTETGYKPTKDQRLRIYLTNSLEESHPDTGTLFANWLSSEANEANFIKRDSPVMCIIGNPPYSGESSNKGEWIMKLMEDYKKEPGGKEKLKERNPKMVNDDYVKFLRYGQHYIEKNGSGVLAFINPHGFLGNPTFRGMRWNLLKTYDKIYTIDLHGNSRKNEVSPDGTPDVNVFDIMQGVSINLFVKTGNKKPAELGKVFHYDLYGKRDFKYDFLRDNSLKSIKFSEVTNLSPDYFFIPKDYVLQNEYDKNFSIDEIFNDKSSGVKTSNDAILVDFDKDTLMNSIENFYNIEVNNDLILKYDYKPFTEKLIYFDDKLIGRSRKDFMSNFIKKENYCLCLMRSLVNTENFSSIFISRNIIDINYYGFQTYSIPIYIYPKANGQQTLTALDGDKQNQRPTRIPNLKPEIVAEIAEKLGLEFVAEKSLSPFQTLKGSETEKGLETPTTLNSKKTFAPIDILDYIYAVLHSPTYREKYKEFLKIDFPKIPYPKDTKTFWQLVDLGSQIREIHLLESEVVENYITQYPIDGDNVVEKPRFELNPIGVSKFDRVVGKVFINEAQYFDNVPELAWNFYIGGYQPAQKWLKDRKERKLEFDDIFHYQKIIVALTETDRLMKEIDRIEIE